jgi:hypothetical protein
LGLFRISTGPVTVSGSTLTNDGTIVFNSTSGELVIESDVVLSGAGEVNLYTGGTISSGTDAELTNGAAQTIRGRGDITAALVNLGEIRADQSGETLALLDNAKTNNGLMKATDGGTLYLEGVAIDGSGEWIADGGTVTLTSTASVTTTGSVIVRNNGKLGLYDDEFVGAQMSVNELTMDQTGEVWIEAWCAVTLADDLDFAMTDEGLWYWAHGSDLTMTGGDDSALCDGPWTTIEVGCEDLELSGPASGDFTLGQLWIEEYAAVALVDARDNGNRGGPGGQDEALYVWYLDVDPLAKLNLNGLSLYKVTGESVAEVLPCESCWGGGDVVDEPLIRLGDVNEDGLVDGLDITAFVEVIMGDDIDPGHICAADVNEDGLADVDDAVLFAELLLGL